MGLSFALLKIEISPRAWIPLIHCIWRTGDAFCTFSAGVLYGRRTDVRFDIDMLFRFIPILQLFAKLSMAIGGSIYASLLRGHGGQ